MSPSLPLLPEPMVKMWPSSSLQAPTSDAFLGTVALAPLPRPHRPRPPRPLFPPRPPRPAFVSRPMSSGILGFSFRGISTILFSCSSKVPRTLVRTFLSNERFSRTFLCQQIPPAALFSRPMDLARHSCTCGSVRCLWTISARWSVSSRRASTTILRVPLLLRRARTRINLESVLKECARATPDARIRPLTHASVDRAWQAESVGSNSLVIILIAIRCSPNL
jgi:hypothetical protein